MKAVPEEPQPQRLVFGDELAALGAQNDRVVVLDADVSTSTQTRIFAERFPDRFFNLGIAEANMVSVAAGLATCGFIPFVSTFALFISMRAGEQVRAQIAFPRLNVKLIGGYAGLSDYGDGASHQSVEDIAVMRAMPYMTVICPSDIPHTRLAVRALADHEGPAFLRISRDLVGVIDRRHDTFQIGKANVLRQGNDVAVIASGTAVSLACRAADLAAQQGIQAQVIDMHTVKPLDAAAVVRAAREAGAIVTVEEHNVLGGLGSAVCEAVCAHCPVPVLRVGIPDRFGESGAYPEILDRAGLSAERIAAEMKRAHDMKHSTAIE